MLKIEEVSVKLEDSLRFRLRPDQTWTVPPSAPKLPVFEYERCSWVIKEWK